MRSFVLFILISSFLLTPNSAFAIDGFFLNVGQGMGNYLIQNKSTSGASQFAAGAFWQTGQTYNHSFLGYSELEIEAYYAQISHHDELNILAVRPVLNFWGNAENKRSWYWQFGVGLSYVDGKKLDDIVTSTHGQFITFLGAGIPLDKQQKHRLTLRYNHYSNGYIETPNPGIDTLSLDWHYRF